MPIPLLALPLPTLIMVLMRFFSYFSLCLLVCASVFSSCKKDTVTENPSVDAANLADIRAYIKKNNLKADSTASGLYYVVEKLGQLDYPTSTSVVTVNYKGYFLDGKVFDSSYDRGQPSTFSLTSVIKGWQEGIPKFKREGKGKLLVPAKLGYGYNDRGSIPGGSVLIFDIELIDFQ